MPEGNYLLRIEAINQRTEEEDPEWEALLIRLVVEEGELKGRDMLHWCATKGSQAHGVREFFEPLQLESYKEITDAAGNVTDVDVDLDEALNVKIRANVTIGFNKKSKRDVNNLKGFTLATAEEQRKPSL